MKKSFITKLREYTKLDTNSFFDFYTKRTYDRIYHQLDYTLLFEIKSGSILIKNMPSLTYADVRHHLYSLEKGTPTVDIIDTKKAFNLLNTHTSDIYYTVVFGSTRNMWRAYSVTEIEKRINEIITPSLLLKSI